MNARWHTAVPGFVQVFCVTHHFAVDDALAKALRLILLTWLLLKVKWVHPSKEAVVVHIKKGHVHKTNTLLNQSTISSDNPITSQMFVHHLDQRFALGDVKVLLLVASTDFYLLNLLIFVIQMHK